MALGGSEMPPFADVYALVPDRSAASIDRFLNHYVVVIGGLQAV